jgi:hypothetical protein
MKSDDEPNTGPERRIDRITIPPCEMRLEPAGLRVALGHALQARLGLHPRLERGKPGSRLSSHRDY